MTGRSLLEEVLDAGLLLPTGVDGIFARGAVFEEVVEAVDAAVVRAAADFAATRLRFPPVLPRAVVEQTGYLRSFPDLLGVVHSFRGGDKEHRELLAAFERGEPWTAALDATEVALCPAACHPVYPLAAGTLPPDGLTFDVLGWCFRHEPSTDPARMQSFRMHEVVRLGAPATVMGFRDAWVERGSALLGSFGLPVAAEPANDPFFGRAGRLLAASQRESELKLELVVDIDGRGVAVASANAHEAHFGETFGIHLEGGEVAHTACVGFGLERVALALFRHHGVDPAAWPAAVVRALAT